MFVDGSPPRRPGANAAVAGIARGGPQGDVGHAPVPAAGMWLAFAAAARGAARRAPCLRRFVKRRLRRRSDEREFAVRPRLLAPASLAPDRDALPRGGGDTGNSEEQ